VEANVSTIRGPLEAAAWHAMGQGFACRSASRDAEVAGVAAVQQGCGAIKIFILTALETDAPEPVFEKSILQTSITECHRRSVTKQEKLAHWSALNIILGISDL
jgi:hypothetical protein